MKFYKHGKYWLAKYNLYDVTWLSISRHKVISWIKLRIILKKVSNFYEYWNSWGYTPITDVSPEIGRRISYLGFDSPYLSHDMMLIIHETPRLIGYNYGEMEYKEQKWPPIRLWKPCEND